jgi:hypothetical protein
MRSTWARTSRGRPGCVTPRPLQRMARRRPPDQAIRSLAVTTGALKRPRPGARGSQLTVTLVRAGSVRHREPLVLGGHQRSRLASKHRRSDRLPAQTSDSKAAWRRVRTPQPPPRTPVKALVRSEAILYSTQHPPGVELGPLLLAQLAMRGDDLGQLLEPRSRSTPGAVRSSRRRLRAEYSDL